MILVLKYLHDFIKIYKTLVGTLMHACAFWTHLHPPLPRKYLCTSCIQSIVLLPPCGSLHEQFTGWLLHAIPCRLSDFSYTVDIRIPILHSNHQRILYTILPCVYSILRCMDSSCWLTHAVQGLATSIQQLLLVGDVWFNTTTSSFFFSCISFVTCCYCQSVYLQN